MMIKRISVNKVTPAFYNPRRDLKPDDKEYTQLVKSMDEFGCVQLLVWNKRTGNLVGGHQRFKVLLAQGAKEVEVSVVDLPLEKEKALNVALNKISGDWDKAKLAELIDELVKTPQIDIESVGFDLPEAEQLIADILGDTECDEAANVLDQLDAGLPAITKPGDWIALGLDGEHRVLCGDVTKPADVAKLMGDSRAKLCHTDPPYNVNYDRNNRPVSTKAKRSSAEAEHIRNDGLTPKRYEAWFIKVVKALSEAMTPGAPFYIWNSHRNFGLMHDLLTNHKFKVSSVITWAKESFAPGFGDYNEQTEFCLYGFKGGARHSWYGPKNASTLWRIRRDRTDLYRHPTQKALELAERAIRNSSKRGDIVLDPFLGSGTTLIAAARLGRRCFGMEIEPKYCDCIVHRYIALAGHKAVSPEILERFLPEEVQA
ncbi:MAG: DNA modification methylase [Planctomycetes bacterium B3_Pla]|nr:MAG: DNA modification methylase [Planctomycetes bacterium B3_Pla]